MLQTCLIFVVLSGSATYVVGKYDDQYALKNLTDTNTTSSWKSEIEEILTDKLVERLENRLTNILEKRLELNFEEVLLEKLVDKLEEKLAYKVEENLGWIMEPRLEKILIEKLESKLEEKLGNKLEASLEAKLSFPLEEKLALNLEGKLSDKVEEKLTSKLEEKLAEKLEQKLENKLEYKLEQNLEARLVKKLEDKFETNIEENLTGKLKIKLEDKNIEKKLTETLQVLLQNKLEDEFKEIEKTYHHNVTQKQLQKVEWVKSNPMEALSLSERAVVAGYDSDGSPLWVIRANFENNIIPGKLVLNEETASIGWNGRVHKLYEIEVFCAPPELVKWVESRDGAVPPCALEAGKTLSGEILYVGRAEKRGSFTLGKVHPEYKCLFTADSSMESCYKSYEVLCLV